MKWRTASTLEAFRESFHCNAEELPEIIRQWRETGGQDYLLRFAQQLQEDFHSTSFDPAIPEDRLAALGMRMALARVDWKQVAERLEEFTRQGPWPEHLPYRCWCAKPLASWPKPGNAGALPACVSPVIVASASREEATGRMDQDVLFSAARSLDLLARELAPDRRSEILEKALLRRAREQVALLKKNPDPKEPLVFRTVWRTSHEPRLVHWLLGGIAGAGECAVFEDRDFTACGSEVHGVPVLEEKRWTRSTMDQDPINCGKCSELFQAAGRRR